jgi:hypothetical protein
MVNIGAMWAAIESDRRVREELEKIERGEDVEPVTDGEFRITCIGIIICCAIVTGFSIYALIKLFMN